MYRLVKECTKGVDVESFGVIVFIGLFDGLWGAEHESELSYKNLLGQYEKSSKKH